MEPQTLFDVEPERPEPNAAGQPLATVRRKALAGIKTWLLGSIVLAGGGFVVWMVTASPAEEETSACRQVRADVEDISGEVEIFDPGEYVSPAVANSNRFKIRTVMNMIVNNAECYDARMVAEAQSALATLNSP